VSVSEQSALALATQSLPEGLSCVALRVAHSWRSHFFRAAKKLSCLDDGAEVIKLLMDAGTIPTEECLLKACTESKPAIVKLLLDGGSNIEPCKMSNPIIVSNALETTKALSKMTTMVRNERNNLITKMLIDHEVARQNVQTASIVKSQTIVVGSVC
jgi:hypothetical protein